MTDQKINTVLDLYAERLTETRSTSFWQPWQEEFEHCVVMIPQIRAFVALGRRDKAFRWLGFMQGVFYCAALYTIKEMADHNRPDEELPTP